MIRLSYALCDSRTSRIGVMNTEEKKPVVPYVKHVEPELTEYAASYVTWPVRPDVSP
jgi:hypothetical protein